MCCLFQAWPAQPFPPVFGSRSVLFSLGLHVQVFVLVRSVFPFCRFCLLCRYCRPLSFSEVSSKSTLRWLCSPTVCVSFVMFLVHSFLFLLRAQCCSLFMLPVSGVPDKTPPTALVIVLLINPYRSLAFHTWFSLGCQLVSVNRRRIFSIIRITFLLEIIYFLKVYYKYMSFK